MKRQLRLNTIGNTKNALAKVTREFYRNDEGLEENVTWFNTLKGLMSELVKAQSVEKNLEIEKRLDLVEKALAEWKRERR